MKSGKSMPVVESELIGHTRPRAGRDTETSAADRPGDRVPTVLA